MGSSFGNSVLICRSRQSHSAGVGLIASQDSAESSCLLPPGALDLDFDMDSRPCYLGRWAWMGLSRHVSNSPCRHAAGRAFLFAPTLIALSDAHVKGAAGENVDILTATRQLARRYGVDPRGGLNDVQTTCPTAIRPTSTCGPARPGPGHHNQGAPRRG